MTSSTFAQTIRRRQIFIPALLVIVTLTTALVFTKSDSVALATVDVKQGPFSVSITVPGEVRAANSFTFTAPRSRYGGQVQVVYMAPEGTTVKPGDVVVRFSTTEVDKVISDKGSELSILKSDLVKMKADQAAQMSDLDANLKNAELAYAQGKLQVEKVKFESEVQRKEAEINMEKSRISYEQAKTKIKSQKIVNRTDLEKNELKIKQTESDITRAKAERELFILKATMPGLVVYEMNWSTGRKIAVGDSPWGGMSVVSLPDLSKMQVVTNVNEVDVSKVKNGQTVNIKLDAFPDRSFLGKVVSVGTIGQQKDRSSNLKTFEVIVDIDGSDPILKPGMTTGNEIVMETIPNAIYVPIESVFEKGGKVVAYRMNGSSPEPQDVEIGPKNGNYVVVTSGLAAGEKVTLKDPTVKEPTTKSESTQTSSL
jgi:HlyD family secretion protein